MADTTDLTPTRCPRCHTPVLAGRVEALDRLIDTDPLTEIGVIAYRATERTLFTVTGPRARVVSSFFRWPPADRTTTVHVEHACERPIPPELRENNVVQKKREYEFPENPNF
ncbi:hypothetical protein [Gordonia sp. NPDC003376]